jgi:hypothetical protein
MTNPSAAVHKHPCWRAWSRLGSLRTLVNGAGQSASAGKSPTALPNRMTNKRITLAWKPIWFASSPASGCRCPGAFWLTLSLVAKAPGLRLAKSKGHRIGSRVAAVQVLKSGLPRKFRAVDARDHSSLPGCSLLLRIAPRLLTWINAASMRP